MKCSNFHFVQTKDQSPIQTEPTTQHSVQQDPGLCEGYFQQNQGQDFSSHLAAIFLHLLPEESAALLTQCKLVTCPTHARRLRHAQFICSYTCASQSPLAPEAWAVFSRPGYPNLCDQPQTDPTARCGFLLPDRHLLNAGVTTKHLVEGNHHNHHHSNC